MNLFSRLSFVKGNDEYVVDPAKEARIKFHRTHVRNGPAKLKASSRGQEKRERVRALARDTRRARRIQAQNFLETRRLAHITRGQLQQAGVLPWYMSTTPIDPVKQVKSVVWLVQRFGIEEEDGSSSLKRNDVLAALNAALKFYGEAVGLPGLTVPDGYELPIYQTS